jgi:hypothetical protein
MTVWLLARHEEVTELSADASDGDGVLRTTDDGYEVGVVRDAREPYIQWRGLLPTAAVGDLVGAGPHHLDDLPAVREAIHRVTGPSAAFERRHR